MKNRKAKALEMRVLLMLVALCIIGAVLSLVSLSARNVPVAHAATITVDSTTNVVADDGVCTLREAITAANSDTASGATAGGMSCRQRSRHHRARRWPHLYPGRGGQQHYFCWRQRPAVDNQRDHHQRQRLHNILRDTVGMGCHRITVDSAGTLSAAVVACP